MMIEQSAGHVTTPIMPARPLCFGRSVRDLPMCGVCQYYNQCLAAWRSVYIRTYHGNKSALLRVYARENHELRARVEALEWLVEVEDAKDAVYWSHDSSEDSWDEYVDIHSCARRNAAFPPLDSEKITSDAMGLKE